MTATESQRPFEIFVEDRMVTRVHALSSEDAINKWIDMEAAPHLAGAAQMYHVDVGAISAKPGKSTARELSLRLRAHKPTLRPV